MTERTLVILKPECLQRHIVSDVLKYFDKRQMKCTAMKMTQATREQAQEHYADVIKSVGPVIGAGIVERLVCGPIIVMIYEGEKIVPQVRKMQGATDPMDAVPGTIRGDFGRDITHNIIHASDSVKAAEKEIKLWFK